MTTLLAGTAREDISPRHSMFLCGYPHVERMSTGTHDPLYVTALCLRTPAETLLLLGLDLLFVGHDFVRAVRERVVRETGIRPEGLLISTTHTHSGPLTAPILAWRDDPVVPAPDAEYLRDVEDRTVRAACRAFSEARPAELAIASARVEGVGTNRLDPEGPRDPEAGLLAVRSRDDRRWMAVELIYGMHPTVLHEDSTLVSADFPGMTRRLLEETFEGAMVLYQTAPCGNLSPRYSVRAQTFAEAERLGRKLAEPVAAALRGLTDAEFNPAPVLAAARTRVRLPARTFLSPEEAEAALRRAREKYARLRSERAGHGAVRTAECEVFGAEESVTLARAQASGELEAWRREFEQAELTVLRIGDVLLAGLPGEWFVEYALEIKARSPARVFVISLVNGELQGYITTPDASGYEAGMSMFRPEAGERMIEAVLNTIETLTNGK